MRRRATIRTAALLAVASLVAAGCGFLGGGGGYTITVLFPRAVALYEEGQVRVLGLPAGSIQDIIIESDLVRVELRIDGDVPIPVDANAVIIPQSLVGERYVQLLPAWLEGEQRMQDLPEEERIIPLERTIIPVEPDEALAALNEFLQSLDPEGLGRLLGNLADGLEGNGQSINDALGSVSDLVSIFAERDQELARIVDNFDDFTATLVTREAQLGQLLDQFAATTTILAEERQNVEALVAGLARVSQTGLRLVGEHADRLRTDLDTLARTTQSVVANLDAVGQLLDSGPLLVDGLADAYNPELRAMNLRTQFGPIAQQVLTPVLQFLLDDPDFALPCIPVDTGCSGGPIGGLGEAAAVPAEVPIAHTPVDAMLDLLAAPSDPAGPPPSPSVGDRVADSASAVGSFLRDAASAMAGGR